MLVKIDLTELDEFEIKNDGFYRELIVDTCDLKKLITRTIEEETDEIDISYNLEFYFRYKSFCLAEATSFAETEGKVYFLLQE